MYDHSNHHDYDVCSPTLRETLGVVRRAWGRSQSRDRFNNTIDYTYTTTFCERVEPLGTPFCYATGLVPSEIRYGAHAAGAANDPEIASDRKVRFVYSTDRADWGSSYSRGLLHALRHRLNAVRRVSTC